METENTRKPRPVFTAFKQRLFASLILVLITTVVMIPGMTTYLPFNKIDTIALPILLFPFIWVGLFIYCFIAKRIWHLWLVLLGLASLHVLLSFLALR